MVQVARFGSLECLDERLQVVVVTVARVQVVQILGQVAWRGWRKVAGMGVLPSLMMLNEYTRMLPWSAPHNIYVQQSRENRTVKRRQQHVG